MNKAQRLISQTSTAKDTRQPMEQVIPQGIVENNRAISWQLVELNSWIWPEKGEKSPTKTILISG